MSRMYISYQTKQSTNTISFLQNRADSVFVELEKAEQEFARVKDINQRIIKASGRLKELQLMRNVEVLNTMYLELVKNIREGAMAKVFASETAMKTTTEAVQVHGGYGFVKEYHVERLMRDAKITQIYEGTSEIQRIVISRSILK